MKYLFADGGLEESISRALRIFGITDPNTIDKDKLVWVRSPVTEEAGEILPYIGTFDGKGGIPQSMADILYHRYRREEWRLKQRDVR